MQRITTLLAITLLLSGGLLTQSYAQDEAPEPVAIDENADGIEDRRARRHHIGGRMGRMGRMAKVGAAGLELSDEQRETLKGVVEGLKEAEASPTEISEAVLATLGELQVELPEGFEENLAERAAQREAAVAQRAAAQEIIEGLGEDATREEVKAALEEAGIEKPSRGGKGFRGRRGFGGKRGGADRAPAAEGGAE